jgi:hypothetical protein
MQQKNLARVLACQIFFERISRFVGMRKGFTYQGNRPDIFYVKKNCQGQAP